MVFFDAQKNIHLFKNNVKENAVSGLNEKFTSLEKTNLSLLLNI